MNEDEKWRQTLCEQPTFAGLKCIHIGFTTNTCRDVCTLYKENIQPDAEGWMQRCPSCIKCSGYVERRGPNAGKGE